MHTNKVFVKYMRKILFQCLLLIIIRCFCILVYDSSTLYLKSIKIVIKRKVLLVIEFVDKTNFVFSVAIESS